MSDWSGYLEKSAFALPTNLISSAFKGGARELLSHPQAALAKIGPQVSTAYSTESALSPYFNQKTAAALIALYDEYGPPKTKHAAANYFFYEANREEREAEALGQQFCKIAALSKLDPWEMAAGVVSQLERFEKLANTEGPAGELAQFYLDWAEDIEKRAGLVGKGLSMLGAGARQAVKNLAPASVKIRRAATAVAEGAAPERARGILSAMKRQGSTYSKLERMGGGSAARGRKMVEADLAAGKATKLPLPTTAPAPAPSTGQHTLGEKILGGTVLGGLGAGGVALYGASQQPQYQGGY